MKEQRKSCFTCIYLFRETESWEMPHIYWYVCDILPQNAMLKQFPFKRTKCKKWKDGRKPRLDEENKE